MTDLAKEGRYYLVLYTDLGMYGNEGGYKTKDELVRVLECIEPDEVNDYTVLYGVELPLIKTVSVAVTELG